MDYTGFVYIWFDRKRKMFYIGSHMGTLEDGYIGSNIRLQRAYNKRPEDFKRKILVYCYSDNRRELLSMEQYYLDMIKYEELHLKNNIINETARYYNIKPTAAGLSGRLASELKQEWWNSNRSDKWRSELSERMKTENPSSIASKSETGWIPWNAGKKCPQISAAKKGKPSPLTFEQHSKIAKDAWAKGCYDNRPKPTEEQRKRMSETRRAANRKQTDYQKQKASEANKGVPKSEEHRKNLSEAAKKRYEKLETCTCCGFVGSGPAMVRWHMGNCRN